MNETIIRAIDLRINDHFLDAGVIKIVTFAALLRGTDVEITYRPKGVRGPKSERKMTVNKNLKITKVN